MNERQKNVLLQIYDSFRKENGFESGSGATDDESGLSADGTDADTASKPSPPSN